MYALPCCSLGVTLITHACIVAVGVEVGAGVNARVRLGTANPNISNN